MARMKGINLLDILVLYYKGYTTSAIAAKLGCSQQNIRFRMRKVGLHRKCPVCGFEFKRGWRFST